MMKKVKVMFVLGTRPEVIKLAPVVHSLIDRLGAPAVHLCVTAQHRNMLDQMMAVFGLKYHTDLNVMKHDQTPLHVIREILAGLEPLLGRIRPNMLIVQGDTTTALAGALAAFHAKIPVAHVEAGLRSHDKRNPFPEEGNRVMVDHLSELLFAPTIGAKENLLLEGISSKKIHVTGNTVVDALQWACAHSAGGVASRPGLNSDTSYILTTIHRRESFGRPIQNIFRALRKIVESDPRLRIHYPVHPNPNIRRWARHMLRHDRIVLLNPLSYIDFVRAMEGAKIIMTDSGGITEEASSLHKPIVILREVTERPELVECGGAVLTGTDTATIVRHTHRILNDNRLFRRMSTVKNPYGDGRSADRIGKIIIDYLGVEGR